MSLEGIIVGVDLDGVCADFYGRMREIAAEWFECRAEDLTENVSYGLTEWGVKPEKYESLHRFAVLQRSLALNQQDHELRTRLVLLEAALPGPGDRAVTMQ